MDRGLPKIIAGTPVRLLLNGKAPGSYNMAVDEALMESSGTEDGRITVRLYGFSPPVLSVGRFQKTAGIIDFTRLENDGIQFVRRPTGGQAVLHDGELTYSITVGKHHLENAGKRSVYRMIVPLLTAGLSSVGIRTVSVRSERKGSADNPDCFASTGEYEIDSADGRKLVGSAQAVSRTAVLQHGSIPIDSSNRSIQRYFSVPLPDEFIPADIHRETGAPVAFETARDAFADGILRALEPMLNGTAGDPCVQTEELTGRERSAADRLILSKYTTDAWNRKY